ncbi:hypothetical protein VR010_07230 [Actinomycetaceae bacterium L2_0104]
MMAAAFRLSGLFRVRRIQEDRAAAELAVAAGERARMDGLTEKARRRLEEADLPDDGESLRWQAALAARSAASVMAREAEAAQAVARTHEDAAQDVWNAARTRTTMIEKLAVRHAETQRVEDIRQEQHVLDEIASQRSQKEETP